jgi:DNA-binding NtrC family response regulator
LIEIFAKELSMESMKTLVVDDEALVRELIRKGPSQKGGYNVEGAQNGIEAIEKIEKDVFDLVLTDLMMSGMDGLELLKAIKGTRPEVMVILMTGHGSIETAVEVMKLFLEYHWPGNVRELENVIERAVIMADQDYLLPIHFPKDLMGGFSEMIKRGVKDRKTLNDVKSEYIKEILKEVRGNKTIASETLGVNPRTLYRFEKKVKSNQSLIKAY